MFKIIFIKMDESDRLKLRRRVEVVFSTELVHAGDFSDIKNAAKYASEFIDNKFFKDENAAKNQEMFNIYEKNIYIGVIWYTPNFITSNGEKVGRICYIEIFEQMRIYYPLLINLLIKLNMIIDYANITMRSFGYKYHCCNNC